MGIKNITLEVQQFGQYLLKDARHFQIFYLSLFLIYGVHFLSWDAEITRYITITAACVLTQIGFSLYHKKSLSSIKSALISALGLCLLLKTNALWVGALAGFVAIASKFLIRYKGKHVFNPANLAIIVCVSLTGEAWVSIGQWGTNTVQVYFFLAAALLVLLKVGRIDTSLGFLLAFAGLEFIRSVLYLDWELDNFTHYLSNGTLLLFAFFMITDPITTPNHPRARILWSILVGVVAFILTRWLQLYSAPIWALIVMSPLTPVFDKIWSGERFSWSVEKITTNSLKISKS
jgi:Na+-transporting NADH:ubiquinone oxidoreductase subunit NqrB